jgi:V/A-type H+/Na+-transporting ATPase subunit K
MEEFAMTVFYVALAVVPPVALVFLILSAFKKRARGNPVKKVLLSQITGFIVLTALVSCLTFSAAAANETTTAADTTQSAQTQVTVDKSSLGLGLLAAAIVTGLAGIGGGIAVAAGAPAAIAATSEDPKSFGKALIFVALGESIALYGVVISILILNKI